MTGEVAQLISLITHFHSPQKRSHLEADNSTFQYCNELSFVVFRKTLFGAFKERPVATTLWEWFSHLTRKKIHTLNLVFQQDNSMTEDHKLAGMVGGGGNWFIEAKSDDFSDFWRPKWEANPHRKEDDKRVWNITYGLTMPGASHFQHPTYNIPEQRQKLEKVLTEIADFAANNKETTAWEKTFLGAKSTLNSPTPELGYYKDMIATDVLPIQNEQLLIAAAQSFVFGGMGSWNDIGRFEKAESQQLYDRLSARLYHVMNESMIAAVNGR